jgi:chromosome segregation ATPase
VNRYDPYFKEPRAVEAFELLIRMMSDPVKIRDELASLQAAFTEQREAEKAATARYAAATQAEANARAVTSAAQGRHDAADKREASQNAREQELKNQATLLKAAQQNLAADRRALADRVAAHTAKEKILAARMEEVAQKHEDADRLFKEVNYQLEQAKADRQDAVAARKQNQAAIKDAADMLARIQKMEAKAVAP